MVISGKQVRIGLAERDLVVSLGTERTARVAAKAAERMQAQNKNVQGSNIISHLLIRLFVRTLTWTIRLSSRGLAMGRELAGLARRNSYPESRQRWG